MAIYICQVCENYIDDDWFPGTEYEAGLICPDCFEEIEDFETEFQPSSVYQESGKSHVGCGSGHADNGKNPDNSD